MSFPNISTGFGLSAQPVNPPGLNDIKATDNRQNVILTTIRIPDDHIWANGLFQNVYIIYRMLEVMGLKPWLMVDNNQNHKDATLHEKFRMLDFKEYAAAPFPVSSYLEIGMSCDPGIRRFFRSMGSKVSKLYLGNILNIDIETMTFLKNVNFSHHVAGEIDEIWVSPHYDFHAEYAGSINALCGKTRIAPYLWDPMFIQDLGQVYTDKGLGPETPRTFVIMEPNISLQKNSMIPIMVAEAYYRRFPGRVEQVIAINGERLKQNMYYTSSILPYITMHRDGKLQLTPRAHIVNLVKAFPSAIVIMHQVNNEYNYSFLEFFTMGFPVVHNIKRFKDYGYYYDENDFEGGADMIDKIIKFHTGNKLAYAAQAKQLTWQFSVNNPTNMAAWRDLLFTKVDSAPATTAQPATAQPATTSQTKVAKSVRFAK